MFKITKTAWYQESVRYSRLSGQRFGVNSIISLALLAALVVASCVMR